MEIPYLIKEKVFARIPLNAKKAMRLISKKLIIKTLTCMRLKKVQTTKEENNNVPITFDTKVNSPRGHTFVLVKMLIVK